MVLQIKKILVFFCLFLAFSPEGFSQMWKRYRKEGMFGIGATNFLGELGGRNAIGRPFIIDFNTTSVRPAVNVGYLYRMSRNSKFRTNLNWGVLRGDDKFTQEDFRSNRNLHFRSHMVEFSGIVEILLNQDYFGNRYRIKGAKTRFNSFNTTFYGLIGIGGFYFNPQAFHGGKWHNLKPMSTEGQGLPGGPKPYSRFNIAIPMGGGVRYALTEKWRVGLELTYRKTFTDYIDDISTVYYDNDKLREHKGDLAANLADPNLKRFPQQLEENGYSTAGTQRGNSNLKDAYMLLMFNLYYILPNKVYRYKF